MTTTIIAVDPPLNVTTGDGNGEDVEIQTFATLGEFIEHLQGLADEATHTESITVVAEDVPCYAGQAIPASRSFKLGKCFGEVIGAVRGLGIRLHLVRPQVWQKGFSGLRPGGRALKGYRRKRVLADHAQRLFPELKFTVAQADSLLIYNHFLTNKQTN